MNDQEDQRHLIQQIQGDLRHLIQQNQKQFQEMQAQINRLHAVVYSGSVAKDSAMDGISPYYYGWRRYFRSFLWTLVIVGLIIGCGWNLREILQDMIESPTVTKMSYTLHDKLPLPPISVYQKVPLPMLHTEKLFKALENGSLTEAYLEVVKGIGTRFFDVQSIIVQSSEIPEKYKEAILQYGSLTEAALALRREYGIACDELITFCTDSLSRPMNCCDIFEFLWGFRGPQYALKRNTIFLDAFRGFIVTLRSFPNMEALQKGDFVEEPENYHSYWIGISNGVDLPESDPKTFEVRPSEVVSITLRQKRRNLKVSKDCIDLPPKLRYFRDYTMSNCFVERCILDKLSLCNISCELPVLQLLNPNNLSGPPCEFDVLNLTCWVIISANQPQCTNHGCRFPCNQTEIEYSMAKEHISGPPRGPVLTFKYETTEVQTFEETSRLTLWEYLSLISSILDLWLGITIYTLYRILHRAVSKITQFKSYDFGKNNSAAAHVASADQQHEMDNFSNTERDRRIRSSHRSYY